MNFKDFEALMGGVESGFVVAAIVVGGFWAWRKFEALVERDRAQAKLQKTQRELDQMQLDRRKTEAEIDKIQQTPRAQAVIEVSIDASQISIPGDPARYVSAVVEIINKGTRNTRLEFSDDRRPFEVSSVRIGAEGKMEFETVDRYGTPVATSKKEYSPSSVVRAGGTEKVPFVFRVASAGLYLLIFSVPVPKEEKEIASKLGFKYGGNWVGKKFIVVE